MSQLFVVFKIDGLSLFTTGNLPEPVERFSELCWDSSQNLATAMVLGSSLAMWEKERNSLSLCFPTSCFTLPVTWTGLVLGSWVWAFDEFCVSLTW